MIWCVEDDASIRDIEVYALNSTGFSAEGFADGAAFWAALEKDRPELVVLDVMLPEIDGIQLLRRMKADPALRDIPVIMATAKGAEYDKILGLDLGADDYLTKPFGVMELVSRVKAVLRRCRPVQQQVLRCGGLAVDTQEHTVTADGVRVELTYKEFQLLRLSCADKSRCRRCGRQTYTSARPQDTPSSHTHTPFLHSLWCKAAACSASA